MRDGYQPIGGSIAYVVGLALTDVMNAVSFS